MEHFSTKNVHFFNQFEIMKSLIPIMNVSEQQIFISEGVFTLFRTLNSEPLALNVKKPLKGTVL